MEIRNHLRTLRALAPLLALSSAFCWSQTPDAAIAPLAGQKLILIKGGNETKIKLKKSELNRLKGACDVAVLVKTADWKAGTARFKLQNIGVPSVMNRRPEGCRLWQEEIVLELSEFALDEPADSLLKAVHQVLHTPEEYLAYNGIPFSIPPGAEGEAPVKPPPPVNHPTSLLRVDGAYSTAARKLRRKGTVRVRLIVGTDGRIHKPQLISGPGFGLDESAMRVLPLWRFEPARQMDKAVAYEATVEMHFDIM